MSKFKCPYCEDTGQIRTEGRVKVFRGREIHEDDASLCICVMNKFISEKFEQLGSLPDALPKDSIKAAKRYAADTYKTTPEKDRVASKRFKHRNLIFTGSENHFFYILKSYFLFFYKYHKFEFLDGLQVVQKYYVEQANGESRSLYDLNDFDLLVLSFTSKPTNKAMEDCVLEVVKNRSNLGKATWIYSTNLESLKTAKEYSDPMDQYLEGYSKCNVLQQFDYEGFNLTTQANPATMKKDISKKIANNFS